MTKDFAQILDRAVDAGAEIRGSGNRRKLALPDGAEIALPVDTTEYRGLRNFRSTLRHHGLETDPKRQQQKPKVEKPKANIVQAELPIEPPAKPEPQPEEPKQHTGRPGRTGCGGVLIQLLVDQDRWVDVDELIAASGFDLISVRNALGYLKKHGKVDHERGSSIRPARYRIRAGRTDLPSKRYPAIPEGRNARLVWGQLQLTPTPLAPQQIRRRTGLELDQIAQALEELGDVVTEEGGKWRPAGRAATTTLADVQAALDEPEDAIFEFVSRDDAGRILLRDDRGALWIAAKAVPAVALS